MIALQCGCCGDEMPCKSKWDSHLGEYVCEDCAVHLERAAYVLAKAWISEPKRKPPQ